MTKIKSNTALKSDSELWLEPPAYPKVTHEVIRELKRMMDEVERPIGQTLKQIEFGRLMGAGKSKISDWYHGRLVEQITHFLCALERLPEAHRIVLLRKLCRECPRLEHARLARDPKVIAFLREILARTATLCFIGGGNPKQRTFLITALGNSVGQVRPEKVVSGIDLHAPVDFVPVAGVRYLRKASDSPECTNSILRLWNEININPADVVLLNGVWNRMTELRRSAFDLATRRNVIVADEFTHIPELPKGESPLISLIRIREGSFGNEIYIEVQPRPS